MTSIAKGNERLLEAAKLVEKSKTFDQCTFVYTDEEGKSARGRCLTPACVLGHYALANPKRWLIDKNFNPRLRNNSTGSAFSDASLEFGITIGQANQLFDSDGCGDAGDNGELAAAFIREFVRRRTANAELMNKFGIEFPDISDF